MSNVVVFAPSPVLTVTVEDHDGAADIHLHAGGQGVWQARMLIALGASVRMCAVLAGETGNTLRHLIGDEGIDLLAVSGRGRSAAYIHDRRVGDRVVIAETAADPLSRHDLDELYGVTLRAALEDRTVILSGPASDRVLSADVYRRLAADLGIPPAAGLSPTCPDSRLDAALAGGLTVVKVSDQELFADGRISGHGQSGIIQAMHKLRDDGAADVIITRGPGAVPDPRRWRGERGVRAEAPGRRQRRRRRLAHGRRCRDARRGRHGRGRGRARRGGRGAQRHPARTWDRRGGRGAEAEGAGGGAPDRDRRPPSAHAAEPGRPRQASAAARDAARALVTNDDGIDSPGLLELAARPGMPDSMSSLRRRPRRPAAAALPSPRWSRRAGSYSNAASSTAWSPCPASRCTRRRR